MGHYSFIHSFIHSFIILTLNYSTDKGLPLWSVLLQQQGICGRSLMIRSPSGTVTGLKFAMILSCIASSSLAVRQRTVATKAPAAASGSILFLSRYRSRRRSDVSCCFLAASRCQDAAPSSPSRAASSPNGRLLRQPPVRHVHFDTFGTHW